MGQAIVNDYEEEAKKHSFSSFILKLPHIKFWPLLLLLIVITSVYLCYLAFAIWQVVPNVDLYTPGETEEFIQDNFRIANDVVRLQWITWPIQVFMTLLVLLVAVLAIILYKKKKLTWKNGLLLVLAVAVIITIGYGLYTDNITTRQYDVWGDNTYYGHYGITMYIYKNGKIPMAYDGAGFYEIEESYQLYHPKLSYLCYAGFMHINSLFFGNNDWTIYQANRILTITIMVMTLYFEYKIVQESNLSDKGKFIMGFVVLFCPVLFRMAAQSNNDPFVTLFMMMAIYFSIRWLKKHTFFNIIMIALSIGLAMASKLSGVTIAVLTAIIFIYVLIEIIIKKDISIKLSSLIIQFAVFAVIVFPLGLFWPLYNYVLYGQPLNYVFFSSFSFYSTESASIFDRIGYFSFKEYFENPYIVTCMYNRMNYPINVNYYSTVAKMFFYGEFGYTNTWCLFNDFANVAAWIINVIALLVFFVFVVASIYLVTKFIIIIVHQTKEHKKVIIANNFTYIMAILFITFVVSSIAFIFKYPRLSSYDMRYYLPIILPIGFIFAKAIEKFSLSKYKKASNVMGTSFILLMSSLAIAVTVFYVAIGTYAPIA